MSTLRCPTCQVACLTPGAVFVAVTTYHDFFGDIQIFYRLHVTEKDGEHVVVREVDKVTGCP